MAKTCGGARWAWRGGWLLSGLVGAALLAGCGKSKDDGNGSGGLPGKPGAQVTNDLKQITLALIHHQALQRALPSPGPTVAPVTGGRLDPRRTPWRIALLPYIEQDPLYRNIMAGSYKGGKNGLEYWLSPELEKLCPKVYAAGSGETKTHYRVFVGNGAAFEPDQNLKITDFTDGSSNTILVVEAEEAVPWTSTQELLYDPKKPLPKLGHPSRDGFYAGMADGSVRYIPKNTDEKTLRAIITRNGNEVFGELPGRNQ